jgi:hypothetical protein
MTVHDDEQRLASALGGPAPAPRRSDDAFARAVRADVEARRSRPSPWAVSLWSGAGAAAALALFVSLMSPAAPEPSFAPDREPSVATLDEEELALPAFASDVELDELEDEELLALQAALDEALSL